MSATPGVDHVESVSRNNLSIIYVWLKWGTDLNAAQTLVQQQAAFAMAAVPKSLGVLPPFVLQYDPSNAPVVQVVVTRRRAHRPAALRLRVQQHRAAARGHPRRRQRLAQRRAAAADQRRRRSRRRRRRATSRRADVAAAVAKSNALLPSGEFISPKFDANVYTNAIPPNGRDDRRGAGQGRRRQARCSSATSRASRTAARRRRSRSSVNGQDAVYLNVLRIPGGNTIEIVDAVKKVVGGPEGSAAGHAR